MEVYVSRQQVNELRIKVFQKVNDWYSMMGFAAGFCGNGEDVLLENCSPKNVRCIVWKFFERQFQIQDECLDLPKSKYGEAKRFIEGVELDSVRAWALNKGFIEVLPERRASGKKIWSRTLQGVNANRRRNGYPPLTNNRYAERMQNE